MIAKALWSGTFSVFATYVLLHLAKNGQFMWLVSGGLVGCFVVGWALYSLIEE